MGKLVGIFGPSGDGKTTSTIINPGGKFDIENYNGMSPESHFIINLDRKELPFPAGMWNESKRNYITTSDFAKIKETMAWIATQEHIKSVSLDTINIYLAYKEFNDRKKMTFDQWRDIANDIIELTVLCNTVLRNDQIAYIFGHTELVTNESGQEVRALSVIGKKSKRTPPEGYFPICLFTNTDDDGEGEVKFFFETQKNRSSAKSPIGMFENFKIPNSLKLVDSIVRNYYKI